MRSLGISILFFFCLLQNGRSQVLDSIAFQHLPKGMSQTSATQIFEDSEGFLWVGTPNGLNKFDGTHFTIYNKGTAENQGLTDGYVESIYEDTEGILYIGTNKGLNTYNKDLNIVAPYSFKPEAAILQSKYIGAILKTNDFLWLGTDNSGVYRYHLPTGETKQILFDEITRGGPSNHYIVELFELPNNHILIITQAAVYVINQDFQVISQSTKPQDISRAIQVNEDHFYLGAHDGHLIDVQIDDTLQLSLSSTPIVPDHAILALALDDFGNVWLGTENAGLAIYTPRNKQLQHLKRTAGKAQGISSNSIWAIHKASNGVMWLGPFKKGLSFYDDAYYKFQHVKNDPFNATSLSNDLVNCFLEEENGNLWIGTDGGGLNYWNRNTGTFETRSLSQRNLHSDVVLSFLKDKSGKLWIGSWAKGLAIYDPISQEYEVWTKENSFLGSNNVTDMLMDQKGRIWIVTLFGGVHVYHPETATHQDVSVRSERDGTETVTVARLFQDTNGEIWVGSQTSGLFRFAEKNGQWVPVHYHSENAERHISNDFINTLFQDAEGTLWVGTQAGLNKYDAEKDTFLAITKANGLYNDAIKAIEQDNEGNLWLSTGGGITQYNPSKELFTHYNENDGLQGNEFTAASSLRTSKGELLFGGSNGFNIFKPESIEKLQDIPKVFVSVLRLYNKEVSPLDDTGILTRDISQTDTLRLLHDQNVVDFEFTALTYRHPERVQFAYYLENFEPDWNYVGDDQHATYTNLSPGTYTLRVKSTNSDGIWVENDTALVVKVAPPYWQTWWFRSLLIGALLVLILVLDRIRIVGLKRYQNRLEEKITLRTKELKAKHDKLMEVADELANKNEEIQRFAFAVSHDLKSPLASIKGIASLIPMEVDMSQSKEMQEYVQYIDETCDMMTHLITDITEIAKLGKVSNRDEWLESEEIIELAQGLVQGKLLQKKVTLEIAENLPKIYGDRNRLIQVFENLLDNAIKYMGTQEEPHIKITISTGKDTISFQVTDNGSGMTAEELERLFTPFERFDGSVEGTGLGLYMVKKIMESHKGSITASSAGKGMGTTFQLSIPKVSKPSIHSEEPIKK